MTKRPTPKQSTPNSRRSAVLRWSSYLLTLVALSRDLFFALLANDWNFGVLARPYYLILIALVVTVTVVFFYSLNKSEKVQRNVAIFQIVVLLLSVVLSVPSVRPHLMDTTLLPVLKVVQNLMH